MGTIITVNKETDVQYNHIKVYKPATGTLSPGYGGWGIRERDEELPYRTPVLCAAYPIPGGTNVSNVAFMLSSEEGIVDPYVSFGIWRENNLAPLSLTRVAGFKITETDAGGAWETDVRYTVNFNSIYLTPGSTYTYYMCVYADGLKLHRTDDGATTDGAMFYDDGILPIITDINLATATTISVSNITDTDAALSAEMWGTVTSWELDLDGGCILEEATDWQNVSACTTDSWTNITNIYDEDAASATCGGNGSRIWIDLGNTLDPVTSWQDLADTTTALFPVYDDQGVRACAQVRIVGEIQVAAGELSVEWSDEDSATKPDSGWQNLLTISDVGTFDTTADLPEIARWFKIEEEGTPAVHPAEYSLVDYFRVDQFRIAIDDGEFHVDHSADPHHVWVKNYPLADTVYKTSIGNIAGAESETSEEFTNRINKD